MAAQLKQANELISSLLEIILSVQPTNDHLRQISVEAKALMKSNPGKLHEIVKTLVLLPCKEKIQACDETFVQDIRKALGDHDPLGLADIWDLPNFSLEHKATVFYNLIELMKVVE